MLAMMFKLVTTVRLFAGLGFDCGRCFLLSVHLRTKQPVGLG